MCNFFSMVITPGGIYHDINNHSHSNIIKKFGIDDMRDVNLVKIEVIPTDYSKMVFDKITIDQDKIPVWFNLECERDAIMAVIGKYTLPELHLSAVSQNGHAIRHLTEDQRTPDVVMAAVSQDGHAIQHLTEDQRTPDVVMAAVSHSGNSFYYLTEDQRKFVKGIL